MYVYVNCMEVKTSISRQTVPLMLLQGEAPRVRVPERHGLEDILLLSDCPFNSNPDCRGKHRVYVYLNGMEVKTSLSRQTVPLILILTAGASTASTCT